MSLFIYKEIEILIKGFPQGHPASKCQVKDMKPGRLRAELPEFRHIFIFIGSYFFSSLNSLFLPFCFVVFTFTFDKLFVNI